MAFPPDPVAADKTNDDAITDDHPGHHNALANAVNDITTELGSAPKGASDDLTTRLSALDTTVAGKLSALTPWTSDIDADTYNLDDVGRVGVGAASDAAAGIKIARTLTGLSASRYGLMVMDSFTYSTGGFVISTGLFMNPSVSIASGQNLLQVYGLQAIGNLSGAGSASALYGGRLQAAAAASGGVTTAYGLDAVVSNSTGTVATGIGVNVSSSGVGTVTTMVGLRITGLATGSTKWAMQVGDYQSYHHGKLTLGSADAPTYALDIKGTAQDRGVIALLETATPTNPSQSDQVLIYAKSDRIVFAFNDAGTMRYKSLLLTGTGTTWAHSTTAP